MKIGLYFGSFNPVHHGHLIIASHVADFTPLEQVWLVVSPQNPLKQNNTLINENHRKHLIDLAIEGEPHLRSSNIEFKLPRPSYTIDTLTYASEQYPQHRFAIVMGGDSFSNIKKWKNYNVLLKRYQVFIYNRPGFIVDPETVKARNVSVLNAPLLDISSTHVREMIRQKKSIRYLVPDIVKEEIEAHQYY